MVWMMPPRERGRPARTMPGTTSPISATWIDRQRRRESPRALPLRFTPKGRLPACKIVPTLRNLHPGGTPALPGAITPHWRGSRRSRATRRRLMRVLGTLLNYWNNLDRRFLNSGYSTTSPAHPRVCPPPARLRAPPSRRLPLKGGVILEACTRLLARFLGMM